MSIESKIRFKAIILYLVAGIAMTVVCLFIYGLRNSIIHQREEIEKQHQLFTLTNELVSAVGKAQISAGLYISTNNTEHINQLALEIKSVDSLITLLSANELIDKNKIQELSNLLSRQAQNLYELNRKFGRENPVDDISKRIKNYEPQKKDNIRIVSVKQDSIFKASERKNLMQRIKEVFSPATDSTLIVINQSIDTFKIESSDSLAILSEVDKIAQNASKRYELNIRAIEQQLADLVIADRQISSQVSTLLIELHASTLNSVIKTIEKSEKSINRNYTISIIGGMLALGLILLFIVLIIYDVNKGKKAREKLKQVIESRHHLLLSVSHDIKSPLGSILGHLELFEKQGEDVHSMKNSARHILALLENLMEYSSLEQGTLEPTYSGFDPGKAGKEIVEMFLPITDAKGLTLKFNSDTFRINSDTMKIKQIIINLVSNAIKYTSRGEVCLDIHVNEEKLLIDVKDTGAGIPADKLNEIFKPFTRLESNNALAHGSGYGMYVVKGLIDLLGGTINILSEVGKGTLIKVEIPVEKAVSVMKNGKKRIAVYEDDPVMAKLVSDMLLHLGHSVVEQDYEVILTDMEMGDISGLDILAAAGDVPVILMTGRGDFSTEKALKTGFNGFLSKPVSMDDLREVFGEGDNLHEDIFNVEEDEEIMEIFLSSTLENFTLLKQALGASDYAKAQSLCHKMLPMFAQLGYPTDEFYRMDAHRAGAYEGWQADVEKILTIKV